MGVGRGGAAALQHIYIYMYVCMYVCMYIVCMYVCMYITIMEPGGPSTQLVGL